MRSFDVCDRVLGDLPLLIRRIEDCRAVARAQIVALTIESGRIMNLEEELQERPVAGLCGIKNDLDRFGMAFVIAIRRILHLSTRVTDARGDHAWLLANQILHAPEAAPGEHSAFRCHLMGLHLIHPLLRRDRRHVVGERLQMHRPIVEPDAAVIVKPREHVLEPVLVVALGKILMRYLPSMFSSRPSASLSYPAGVRPSAWASLD